MRIFAISDLHLSFSGQKPMTVFGDRWEDHSGKVERAWREVVSEGDVVCLAGDFSWATKIGEVLPELSWLGSLPGKKVLVKGNHDYWWASLAKVRNALPEGVFALQNDSVKIGEAVFCGARGWVDPSIDLGTLYTEVAKEGGGEYSILGPEEDKKLFEKELWRLEASLLSAPESKVKVALLHFPPASPSMEETPVTRLLEKHSVGHAVFGHLHLSGPTAFKNPYGSRGGVTYHLTSADFIDFRPVLIAEVD